MLCVVLPAKFSQTMRRLTLKFGASHSRLLLRLKNSNKILLLIVALISTVFLITTAHYLRFMPLVSWTSIQWEDTDFYNMSKQSSDEIVILRWTKFFKSFVYKSPQIFRKGEFCEHPSVVSNLTSTCRITYDRRYLKRSQAVIFHFLDLVNGNHMGEEMPPRCSSHQIWIYANYESPDYQDLGYRDYLKGFNWTMTYRRDSDVYDPYGRIELKSEAEKRDELQRFQLRRQITSKKTKLVAWIVSNCKTPGKRENFVAHLQQFIRVDIFGKCGNYSCQQKSKKECYASVSKEYKFYLSFENAFCVDYVTEKMFYALDNDILPVVYGGADYSFFAPPHSYINARDFKSARELATYLGRLDNSMEKYLEYFRWKAEYKVGGGFWEENKWCALCQKIDNESRKMGKSKIDRRDKMVQENVQHWWKFKDGKNVSACEKPANMMA